ncbi:SDR family NAD(P)-dependent oxidoreductase, partial [Klebsiella pneumoniae]|nr:SDR family NAD(P)-dependent oxidoreductase [Klebsiella pneumoniae]
MDLQLNGKTAVITGASVGIGLAIAEGLAAEGTNL